MALEWGKYLIAKPVSQNRENLISEAKKINNVTFIEQVFQNELNYQKQFENLISKLNDKYYQNGLKNKNSLELLQEELMIIKLLSKYCLENNNLDKVFFINSLDILFDISETLRNRIKQQQFEHVKQDKNLVRSSYKFCNKKDNCEYNYGEGKKTCGNDHYVHNMVSADIISLLDYIDNIKINDEITSNKEILKTINTLQFVISHMESELKTVSMYGSENIEGQHQNKA